MDRWTRDEALRNLIQHISTYEVYIGHIYSIITWEVLWHFNATEDKISVFLLDIIEGNRKFKLLKNREIVTSDINNCCSGQQSFKKMIKNKKINS